MSKTHADIEAHLDFSEKFRKQLEAHQHETAQLLTDMEQLQGEVRNLLDENEQLNAECDAKDARIAELEARVAQLESRPMNVNGPYLESVNIERYLNLPPTSKRPRRIKPPISTNDLTLPLWESNIAS